MTYAQDNFSALKRFAFEEGIARGAAGVAEHIPGFKKYAAMAEELIGKALKLALREQNVCRKI